MVNHSAYSYRTSRGVFSNGYCPWCSPYRAKLLNDIDDVCGDMDLIEGIDLALDVSDPQGVHLSMSHDNGIDCEDLFRLPPDYTHADVIDSSYGHIKVLDHRGVYVSVPCTYLDIK